MRESREIQRINIERASSALVNVGVEVVKRNPIKVGLYLIGILICFLFNGWKVSPAAMKNYEQQVASVDYSIVEDTRSRAELWRRKYHQSKGWFSCNSLCQMNYNQYQRYTKEADSLETLEDAKLAKAKSNLGVFSEHGVAEAREMFWNKFSWGREFATRQTMWDAVWMTFGALRRDESVVEYIVRLLFNFVVNLTLGVIFAVIFFITSLYNLLKSYQPSWPETLSFFLLASLAGMSFALTWLLTLYVAVAGTVFVGGRLLAQTIRIQDADDRRRIRRVY